MNVYFDYQSSKPVDPRVIEAMNPYFHDNFGNPSSLHSVGDDATEVLEACRKIITGFINAEKDKLRYAIGQ